MLQNQVQYGQHYNLKTTCRNIVKIISQNTQRGKKWEERSKRGAERRKKMGREREGVEREREGWGGSERELRIRDKMSV